MLLVAVERGFHSAFSIPRWAAIPCCSSTCSGSIRTRRSTSWCCLPWASSAKSSPSIPARSVFGYRIVAFSSVAIAVLGFLVWGHHMFVAGQSVYASLIFSFLSFFVAVPSAIKVFNWTATLYKGSISYDTPMLYAFGFIGLFTIGGLTGTVPRGARLRRACHRHLFRRGAFPLHHGRRHPHGLSRRPPLLVAEDDRPHVSRRLGQAFRAGHLPRLQSDVFPAIHHGLSRDAAPLSRLSGGVPGLHVLSTAGASVLAVGYLIPAVYFIWSLR